MNTVELLMNADIEKLKEQPTAELKIKRLSELLGSDFIVKLKAISSTKYSDYTGKALDDNQNLDMSKWPDSQALICIEGIVEPDLRDKDLQEKFAAPTPKELLRTIFKGGEITAMTDKISQLSGYSDDVAEEIKN